MMRTSKVAALAGLLVMLLPACSTLTYAKAGMTNEDVSRDLAECAEIARHEGFREIEVSDFRSAILILGCTIATDCCTTPVAPPWLRYGL